MCDPVPLFIVLGPTVLPYDKLKATRGYSTRPEVPGSPDLPTTSGNGANAFFTAGIIGKGLFSCIRSVSSIINHRLIAYR